MMEFNPSSSQHISLLFFGGYIKAQSVEPVIENGQPVLIKSGLNKGQLKTKKIEVKKEFKGLGLKPLKEWKTKKEGFYSTNDEVLQLISKSVGPYEGKDYHAALIAQSILKIRELEKQLNTYYESIEELIYPNNYIHAQFIHVSTDTARLSSKNPNIQNVPTGYSQIKEHFISRYPNGVLISADYSQLEIRVQAQLSNDRNYIQDILDGVDFHVKRLAAKEKTDYETLITKYNEGDSKTTETRSLIKGFSFARAYGAGADKIAQQTGLSKEEVNELIKNEDEMYPDLKKFNDWNMMVVTKQGWYKDPWGRRYKFKKFPALPWQRREGLSEVYSPTQVKNYMIQGFATGTIVPIMVGHFWRQKALYNRDKYLLINTVHDSLMLDCREEFVEDAKKDLTILEDIDKISREVFNYEMKVPFTVDTKIGNSWLEV